MSIFQALSTPRWAISVKSERTPKWLPSRPKPPLERQPAFPAGGFTRYVRHFDASGTPFISLRPHRRTDYGREQGAVMASCFFPYLGVFDLPPFIRKWLCIPNHALRWLCRKALMCRRYSASSRSVPPCLAMVFARRSARRADVTAFRAWL